MRKREKVSYVVDSLYAIVQTVLFAIIPVLIKNYSIQVVLYVSFLFLQILYLSFLRNLIIDKISHPEGINTEYLLRINCGICFRNEIMTKIDEIQKSIEINESEEATRKTEYALFDEYIIFLKWKDATDYIIQHFWDKNKTKNTIGNFLGRFLPQNIYEVELLQAVWVLDEACEYYKNFNKVQDLFNNATFSVEVSEKRTCLESIIKFLIKK